MSAGRLRAWEAAVLDGRQLAPVVLLLGGFLTSPPLYAPLVHRLRARGAAGVVVANVWTPDWLLAAGRGVGPILTRSGRGLLEASALSAAVGHGAPVLAVGHSAGGMTARLLTSPEPFAGRRLNASGRIGAIVTLGTPHVTSTSGELGRPLAARATAFANREVAGPAFEPATGYLAVTSRLIVGRPRGTLEERGAWWVYQGLVADRDAVEIEGDGLVPVRSALLPGAPSLILDDAAHGQFPGRDWYGSDRFLDRWWPLAVASWEAALQARADGDVKPLV